LSKKEIDMETKRGDPLSEAEECCTCEVVFDYPKSLDIHAPERLGNYVEGMGQICPTCAKELLHPVQVIPTPFQ